MFACFMGLDRSVTDITELFKAFSVSLHQSDSVKKIQFQKLVYGSYHCISFPVRLLFVLDHLAAVCQIAVNVPN